MGHDRESSDGLASQEGKPPAVVEIGPARFDFGTRRLALGGAVVELDHRPTELLIMLLGRRGQTVPKNEIMDHLWPDRAVTEASLTKCVRQLRLALGDHDHELVRTVHGQGFRIEAFYAAGAGAEAGPRGAPEAAPLRLPLGVLYRPLWAAAALLLVMCATVALWRVAPAMQGAHVPPEPARGLYIKGMQDWAQRSPASLTASVDEFTSALRIDPDYADAYVGLANAYNLLREYGSMPEAQAFNLAKKASEQALRLNPDLAGAHAAHAFVVFWGDWDFPAGTAEFERALQLEPDNPGIHQWFANTLDVVGERARALAHIDRALELSPESRSIRADRANILSHMGRMDEARALLAGLTATDPAFPSPHSYLAQICLTAGDDACFLRESALFAQTTHRPASAAIVAAAAAAETAGGHRVMMRALVAARLAAFQTGGEGAAELASAYALAGDRPAALRMLTLAIDRHELMATFVLNDPGLRLLAVDQAAAALLARLRLNPAAASPARGPT